MKKWKIGVLCLCCLLCGCGEKTVDMADLQQQYAMIGKADMEAEIVCHLPEENRSFTVQCHYEKEGNSSVTVTAPEALAGIGAAISGDDLTVSYDGTTLAAGEVSDLSAVNCLPWLIRAAAEGYVVDWNQETVEDIPCLRATLDTTGQGGKTLCSVWFDKETLLPRYAEFAREEQVVLSVKMLSFTWEAA